MQPNNKPLVIAIMGPTASGKTELAIDFFCNINGKLRFPAGSWPHNGYYKRLIIGLHDVLSVGLLAVIA